MDNRLVDKRLQIALGFILILNIAVWFALRHSKAEWGNVPPAPAKEYAAFFGLGDAEFTYRLNGIMLQNLGNSGGIYTPLKDYDFTELAKWFYLQDSLDEVSNYIPYLATYYFGSVQEPNKFRPVIPYLEMAGAREYAEKWRWLVQAVYMARHRIQDKDLALDLAYKLAETKNPDAPNWVRQMPAFVLNYKGDKDSAYALMVEILKSSADKMHPNEVNATRAFICEQILSLEEAGKDPICTAQ